MYENGNINETDTLTQSRKFSSGRKKEPTIIQKEKRGERKGKKGVGVAIGLQKFSASHHCYDAQHLWASAFFTARISRCEAHAELSEGKTLYVSIPKIAFNRIDNIHSRGSILFGVWDVCTMGMSITLKHLPCPDDSLPLSLRYLLGAEGFGPRGPEARGHSLYLYAAPRW